MLEDIAAVLQGLRQQLMVQVIVAVILKLLLLLALKRVRLFLAARLLSRIVALKTQTTITSFAI